MNGCFNNIRRSIVGANGEVKYPVFRHFLDSVLTYFPWRTGLRNSAHGVVEAGFFTASARPAGLAGYHSRVSPQGLRRVAIGGISLRLKYSHQL